MPEMKAVDLNGKRGKFIHDSFHYFMYLKPAGDVLKKTNDHLRNARNKRLETLQLEKDDACCAIIDMEDEGKKRCVDGNNVTKDVVFFLMIWLMQIFLMLKRTGMKNNCDVKTKEIFSCVTCMHCPL